MASSLQTQFPVANFWNLGGPGVYSAQLESGELRQNTRRVLTCPAQEEAEAVEKMFLSAFDSIIVEDF